MSLVSRLGLVVLALSISGCGRSGLLEDSAFDTDLGVFRDLAGNTDMPGTMVDLARRDMPRQPDLARRDFGGNVDLARRDFGGGMVDLSIGNNDIGGGMVDLSIGNNDIGMGGTDLAVTTDLARPDLAGCALNCSDGNPCTVDFCDATGTCQHQPAGNGTLCNDGNLCTVGDRCFNGNCFPGNPANCADGNTCTIDSCNPAVGCVHNPRPNGSGCFTGDPCTVNDQCIAGVCVGVPRNCADNDPCTIDFCSRFGNCIHLAAPTGTACNDNNSCTTNDTCGPGAFCSGTPVTDGQMCGAGGSGCCVTGLCCQGPGSCN